jgi:hypothetical protein
MDQFCLETGRMHRNNAVPRSDRVLFAALAVILATVSVTLGAAATYRPIIPSASHIVAIKPAPAPVPRIIQDVALTQLLAEHHCLTEALYYEARGEGQIGQQAVAEVVFHRLRTGKYGHSICAVVYEGANHPGCQFSFTCNGALLRPLEAAAWRESEQLAAEILTGAVRLRNTTLGATNYHATYVSPYWAPALQKTTQIGNHIFYRASLMRGFHPAGHG